MTRRKSLADALRRTALSAADPKPETKPLNSATLMADDPAPETARPRRALPVELAAIRVADRLRLSLDTAKVETIAASMAEIGLQSPVLLRPWRAAGGGDTAGWGREDPGLYGLVAGAHRLEAARRLGWTRIEAMIVDGTPDEIRLVEVDENLARAELTALDRTRFLAARKAIHTRLNPDHGHGGDRKSVDYSRKNQGAKFARRSFPVDAADLTQLSRRAIYRAVEIGEGLCREVAAALATTPIADREGDLHRIARMTADEQRELADRIRPRQTPPATLRAVLGTGNGDEPAPGTAGRERHGLDALKRVWGAANLTARRQFLAWVAAEDDAPPRERTKTGDRKH